MALVSKVDADFDYRIFERSCCAFGVFDGVHRGHRFIIRQAHNAAVSAKERCLVVTFDIDPDELFSPSRLKKLMTNERRLSTLSTLDVDAVIVLPFTVEFAGLAPFEFLDKMFLNAAPSSIHVGADFHFGAKAAGSVEMLEEWGKARGMKAFGYGLELYDGVPVTSTRIRALLQEGDIEGAETLLCAPYRLEGIVAHGREEGRNMGFRTANLSLDPMLLAVGEGVYAAWAHVGGERYSCALSVGVSPTFADSASANVEAHLLDFDDDIYGKTIEIEFVKRLREMRKFDSNDELIQTVLDDINWVRTNLVP